MDDGDGESSQLLALIDNDCVAVASPPASGASPSEQRGQLRPLPAATASEADEPPAKRLRSVKLEGDSAGASPAPVPVKSEALAPLLTRRSRSFGKAGASPGGQSSNIAPRESVPCRGCDRIQGVSPCFLVVGEYCVWNSPCGSGSWCRDCHTTWRSAFKPLQALAYFHVWLQMPANRLLFNRTLLAYLSLACEDTPKITVELLQKRSLMLQWLWGAIEHDPFQGEGASPTDGFIRKWLAKLSGAPPAEVSVSVKEEEALALQGSPSKARSRLAKRLDGHIPAAFKLLARFGEDDWSELCEGMFSKPAGIMSNMLVECGHICEDDATVRLATQ